MNYSIYEKLDILKKNCPNSLTLLVLEGISKDLNKNKNLSSKDLKFVEEYWSLISVNYSTRPVFARRHRNLQK